MTSLRTMQELFLRCVRFDPAPDELEDVFAASPSSSARDCMATYREMYWYRLVDALFDVFPRVAEQLGPEQFTRLACRYIAAEPSRYPELERAGHAFARFIAEGASNVPDRERLAGAARLEYAALEVLLAPDRGEPIALQEIDGARFPLQKLVFTPAVALVEAGSDALEVFERRPVGSPRAGGVVVLLHRARFAVLHRTVELDEASALASALEGRSIADVCASFATPNRAAEVIRRWFDDGLVCALADLPQDLS